ncbi:MAG: response regulator [Sphingobium sp.]|uniref:response regulator n=1 Tax=Sphingobium sp. TaxID=1912891 RepID=UPI0029A2E177|nr:response regulator [Sphingobium sp.]MDX3909419.1 response regulator [Sphingobium sp.]
MAYHVPPLNILIVEDEALLAMDIEAMILDSGHCVIGEAASLRDVLALDLPASPDVAFVDIQLDGSSGLDVCTLIQERWSATAVVFVTANPKKIPDDFCGAHGVIPKPFSRAGLMSAMRYIEDGICDPPPASAQPSSFLASPKLARAWA